SRRSLIVKQTACVGVDRALQTNFLGQEPERHLQLERGAPIFGTAKRVHRGERVDGARTDAVRRETADEVRTHLEVIQHAQILAQLRQQATLQVDQADDVGYQRGVVLQVSRGLEIGNVATDAGEVLPEVDQQAVGRVPVVVERVVVQGVAERRGQDLAALQFLAH